MAYIMTSLKVEENRTYTKQVSAYNGYVQAEIIYSDKETDYDYGGKLWYCSLRKTFGSTFRAAPREKDYIAANKWADEQLELLQKYCTVKVKKSECIYDLMNRE